MYGCHGNKVLAAQKPTKGKETQLDKGSEHSCCAYLCFTQYLYFFLHEKSLNLKLNNNTGSHVLPCVSALCMHALVILQQFVTSMNNVKNKQLFLHYGGIN